MQPFIQYLSQQLSEHFKRGIEIKNFQQVYGGDISESFHLHTNAGEFFLKINEDSLQNMFEKEFAGLQLLHDTKTIKAPQPLQHGSFENTIFLVTEFIQKGSPSKDFWKTFAQQLAALHKISNKQFGLDFPNYIGSLQQSNTWCNSWPEFYATQRIMPLIKQAYVQQKCSATDVSLAEKLCIRFDELFPNEAPALIHGDLWSGNFMSAESGEPVIYDPAVYYGNREMDIAMSLLFGGFDKSFYNFYNEVFQLQPGWKERVKLCQLYPLLVHLVLFGGHYYHSVMDITKAYR